MDIQNFQSLNQQVGEIWDANADFWNDRMGEGNQFHNELLRPTQERLLDLRPDELVLDVACGNGQFARQMAQLGARVVASDISPRMIENAKARTTENAERIEYHVIDATDHDALLALGERRFDAAVCTMAIMDMASIEPLFTSLAKLLKPAGRFVFSVMHPCFNSSTVKLVVEQDFDDEGEAVFAYSIKSSRYIKPRAGKGLAMLGQPNPQYYFDRSISLLLNTGFDAGFVVDGIEEPTFAQSANNGRPNWSNFTDIPPVLTVRMRVPDSA